MFAELEQQLISLADRVPLEVFAPLASFVEEVIAPIPSPVVMLVTGSLAAVQGKFLIEVGLLVLLAALGKTLGALIVYFIADKAEDVLAGWSAKFFGITHQDIEAFGGRLGKGPRDYIVLTILRALPIVPSSLVSIGCGLLKVKIKLFVVSTFLGTLVRDAIYIYIGFVGAEAFSSFLNKTASIESFVQMATVLVFVIALLIIYLKRKKHDSR